MGGRYLGTLGKPGEWSGVLGNLGLHTPLEPPSLKNPVVLLNSKL